MREIKFRAWDNYNQVMSYSSQYPNLTSFFEYVGRVDLSEGFALAQYTCLKDKNGEEIYEGDILKTSAGNYPVIWDNDGLWGFDDRHPLYFSDINQREVIGNIYENPELLDGEK